ncbi:MAG: DUF4369 domain-containing protein [Barnesiella sp.]|nr:DUF4369 domain-containing protein [Barnesiella sp.]
MRFLYPLLIIAALLATGCGKKDSFTVTGSIDGAGSSIVELLYCIDGAYTRLSTTAENGKFTLTGSASEPAVAFLSVSSGSPLVELTVVNGADIHCEINPEKPFEVKIKGDKVNEEYARFLNTNSDVLASADVTRINHAVKTFVGDNRKSMAATVALITQFRAADNEISTDSLISIIDPEARPKSLLANYNDVLAGQLSAEARENITALTLINRNDSVVRYNPFRYKMTLLAFTGDGKHCRDSILPRLRSLRKDYPAKKLAMIEVNTSPDSTTWKRVTAKDTATWVQVWQPGSVASPSFRRMAVARVPFFIVVDSVGTQLHRGSSASVAERFVRQHCVNSK